MRWWTWGPIQAALVTTIDNLSYIYTGNLLDYINDAGTTAGVNNTNSSGTHYTYDDNGIMVWDKNNDIEIDYNYLNLPKKIEEESGTGVKLVYIYNANGTWWMKQLTDGSTITKTMYAGGFVYEDNDGDAIDDFGLDYILNPEGKIDKLTSSVEYQYNLKDHLGNTRVVFNGGDTIKQKIDYYPFGMIANQTTSIDNKYLYNGKELQDEQIGGVNLDWYDYGKRYYDPALARFHTIDPKAEDYLFQSPYAYAADNPILFIDENGENPGLLVAALWEASGIIAGVLTATLVANKVYQDNAEGIRGTNNKPNHLEGTSTSRGNPTPSSSPNNNNFNPLDNLDGAVITTIGTIAAAIGLDLGLDSPSENKGNEGAEMTNADISEMNTVCGEHLSHTDPEYWNNGLTDEQRQGYNDNRNEAWQQYLLERDPENDSEE